MEVIHATVTRNGKWWVADFTINGHEYGTQARNLSNIAAQVADAAALMTDHDSNDFTVTISAADPAWAAIINDYKDAADKLQRAQEAAQQASRAAVTTLQADGLSGREVAMLMGLSPQRISQIAA